MGIELTTSAGTRQIDCSNFVESMRNLESLLKPGTPVMFLNYSWSDMPMSFGRRAQRILFFSGGGLGEEGAFTLQTGKRNFSYVVIDEKDPTSYRLARHWQEALHTYKVSFPKSWTREQHNEGTFSPAGPESWSSQHSGGTEQIVVGDILEKRFPDALSALRFGQDAVYFELDSFYSTQAHRITEIGDKSAFGERETQRDLQVNRMAYLWACMNLINEAKRGGQPDHVIAHQVGWFTDLTQRLRKDGYPVDDKDYMVEESSPPNRNIAFVKTGSVCGGAYILPDGKEMEGIVELAFSEKMVREHYPHGLNKRRQSS